MSNEDVGPALHAWPGRSAGPDQLQTREVQRLVKTTTNGLLDSFLVASPEMH